MSAAAAAISGTAGRRAAGAAAMPRASATATGSRGARWRPISFARRDQLANGRELLGPDAEDLAERFGRLEATAALALLQNALCESAAHARQTCELVRGRPIDVEGTRVCWRTWGHRQLCAARLWRIAATSRWLGGRIASTCGRFLNRRRGRGLRARRGGRWRRRLLAIEALESIGELGKARAPL